MSVLLEALSVVVRIRTLEERYPAGLGGYRADCPNATFCSDEHLTRVGFMAPDDVGRFVLNLSTHGVRHTIGDPATDVVVVDQFQGPTTVCGWIAGGRFPEGYSAAWLTGTEPGDLSAPKGWTLEQSKNMLFVATEDIPDQLIQMGDNDGVSAFRDRKTGKQVFTALIRRWLDR